MYEKKPFLLDYASFINFSQILKKKKLIFK